MKEVHAYILSLFFLFFSCSEKEEQKETYQKGQLKFSLFKKKIETEYIDSLTVEQLLLTNPEFKSEQNKLHKFYSRRKYQLAWSKHGEFLPQASMFINILNNIESNGVEVEDKANHQLSEKYKQITEAKKPHREEISLLRKNLDLLLTASFFKYSKNIWRGTINPKEGEIEWYIDRKKIKYGRTLDSILANTKSENPFLLYEPLHNEYHKLKKLLEDYRKIYNKGGWPLIQLDPAKKLAIGDTSTLVPLLKQRLYLSGDLTAMNKGPAFDISVENAIKHFQKRHGLKENGVVDKGTLHALNVPVDERIRQIIINMERWRWVPQKISDNYVLVNIPEFKLHVFENNKEIWNMNVIVGRAPTGTPIFNDEIEYIVVNPAWNVPSNIAVAEVVPFQRKDSMFLEKQNMEVTKDNIPIDPSTINWDSLSENDIRQLSFRQLPGEKNALGHVKFIFPNEYDVYLHDTPKGHLFSQAERDFSHGCIRLEDPLKFAAYLLKDNPEWSKEKISEAIYNGTEQFVKLEKKIPVYIVYFTAWVDEQGLPNFREDIYDHDKDLSEVFFEK